MWTLLLQEKLFSLFACLEKPRIMRHFVAHCSLGKAVTLGIFLYKRMNGDYE